MNRQLTITLSVIAAYLTVLGILFLFFPSAAETLFSISLPDKALNMLYGQVVLTLGYMAYRTAKDPDLAKMYAGFVALFSGHILVFIYQLISGLASFAQNGPPLVVSVIFTVLLLYFGLKQS